MVTKKQIMDAMITLPSSEEITSRLIKVDGDVKLQNGFYPLIAKHGDEKKDEFSIAAMIFLAIHRYTEERPSTLREVMNQKAPKFIEALVDNKETAKLIQILFSSKLA